MDGIIVSQKFSFSYHGAENNALEDVDLCIKPGECVLLCGKSGCGKTTLTHLLNGLSPAFFKGTLSGTCAVCNLAVGDSPVEAFVPIVGSVFQNPKTQYFNIDTTAELAFPCENAGMPPAEIEKRLEETVKLFGIGNLMGRSIFKMSGGEKQRITFAAACMLKPQILVLDEPTSSLDQKAISELGQMIHIMKEQGCTVILAEHRLAWSVSFADRYLYIENGRLAHEWSCEELLRIPAAELESYGLRAVDLSGCREKVKKKTGCHKVQQNLLYTSNLKVGYDKRHPLPDIPDISFGKAEIVGIMGHNGVGKSTLVRTLCGLLKPLGGGIYWNGQKADAKTLQNISFLVMQDVCYQLFSDSVEEEILLGAKYPERCEETLNSLDLSPVRDRHPQSLSGGQKQRTAIASAVMSGKPLIFLDEPTSGLDFMHMEQVGQMLKSLCEQGKTIVIITHDEELAAKWCDRIIEFGGENYV